jgi:hypothetical protein
MAKMPHRLAGTDPATRAGMHPRHHRIYTALFVTALSSLSSLHARAQTAIPSSPTPPTPVVDYPCYVAYVHGSGTDLQYAGDHEGFGDWIPTNAGEGGGWIEREWTPDRSPADTLVNSFTYYSSRQYDASRACAVYRVGYNGLEYWWEQGAAGLVSQQLNDFITRYAIPDKRLTIVTHSMGGIVGRWILNNGAENAPFFNYNGDYATILRKTGALITVEAPHSGTQVADAIYGEADHYISDGEGDIALIFGGQDRSNARDSLRRAYMRDAATWMGDAGRNVTMFTIGGEAVDDNAGEFMDDDSHLQLAWQAVCYDRGPLNGWGSLCGFPVTAAFTFTPVPGDGLVELYSSKGVLPNLGGGWRGGGSGLPLTTFIQGARREWLQLHFNHNQGRYDKHWGNVIDNIEGTSGNAYLGSYIGRHGIDSPCGPGGCWRGTPP